MSAALPMIEAFYTYYNAHDAAAVGALYAAEGVHNDVAGGKRREGRASVETGAKGFFDMLPDVVFTTEATVLSRGSAVVFYRMVGHLGRDLGPMPTKGRRIELSGSHVFTFVDGLIQSTTDYWDEAEFRSQLPQ